MLKKICSGGQTGADIAGVMAAHDFGIETGGYMPKGFITLAGPKPEWGKKYGFVQHESPKYPGRTFKNAETADGTIRLAGNFQTAGEILTLKAIRAFNKPFIDVDFSTGQPSITPGDVVNFINANRIETLNVAGNSENSFMGITGDVYEFMSEVFALLGFKKVENEENA